MIWAVALVIALTTMVTLGDRFTMNEEFRTDLESRVADDLITERLNGGAEDPAQERVIVSSTDLTVDDPAFAAVVADVAATLGAHREVTRVETWYDTGMDELVSFDRHRTVIVTTLAGDPADVVQNAQPVLETIYELHTPAPGFEVLTLGAASVTDTFNTTAEEGIAKGESIGIIVALIVMAVVFGTLVAAGLPIVLTVVALLLTTGMAMAVSHIFGLNAAVMQMIAMIGLAVGIDYTLFIVSRYREEREQGLDIIDAITRAGDTASKAVLFSGLTVVASLLGMLVVPWNLMTSVAGAIVVVLVSVLMTLTLLPAALGLIGDRINWGRIPFIGYRRATTGSTTAGQSRFWSSTSHVVMRRPLLSLVASAGLLLVLGSFTFSLHLGYANLSNLPEDSDSIRAVEIFERDFPGADYQPATIVVTADDVTAPEVRQAIDRLLAELRTDSAFGPATTVTSEQNDLARIDVALLVDGDSDQAMTAVQRLRDEYLPPLFDPIDAEARVTGETAFLSDVVGLARTYLPIVVTFVLAISFLLLLLAFRSIVVPLKAITMNLLSVFASYGLMVLVFQHGIGADLLGFRQVEQIDAFVLLFLFCILFGLSMDYHVFLLSRIKEQFDASGDNEQAVASGLRATGRLITGAALIMVGVFGGFAAADIAAMQQFGFGLAAAVFLDATVVRMILVPASMALLGSRNWYLPAWLSWLPEIHIEGTPARDAPETLDRDADGRLPELAVAD
ncbi:MAG: MMPL family transporter [Chloroflexota bacterium]|nr:MMPL family transporter [Chloroflexota bacterium]